MNKARGFTTVKISTEMWIKLKQLSKKEGRKQTWYVEEALKEYFNGKKD